MDKIYFTIFCVQRFHVNSAVYVHMAVQFLVIFKWWQVSPLCKDKLISFTMNSISKLTHTTQNKNVKADSHIACGAHAIPLPTRATKGLECVFPIWFTQCGRVWFTRAMPRPCHALTMPFFSRPRHSTAVKKRPVGYLPAFGFFRLPHGVSWRLLSEAYQSSSQRFIPATVKSGSSTLQKRWSVKLLD
jgi:hypothetical protein